jgi:HEPN domain-containing protein
MTERPEIIAEVWRWVEKADHDLRNAEYVLTLAEDCPTDTVCFHCQQCAEKYLKALLILRGISFPKTHDLVVLFNLLGGKSSLSLRIVNVQPLNRYSLEARYPGDWNPIDMEEAAEAVKMARGVRDAVRKLLHNKTLWEESNC